MSRLIAWESKSLDQIRCLALTLPKAVREAISGKDRLA